MNLSSTFFGLKKAQKIKEFLFEMDNYYNIQKVEEIDKFFIIVTLLRDYAL